MEKTSIYIDSRAWNYLFRKNIDLAVELPHQEFDILITREVEIEIESIPGIGKGGIDKFPLKDYIEKCIEGNHVRTTSVFGFASVEPDGSLSKVQVYGGFDVGTFKSAEDREWYASDAVKQHFPSGKKKKNSGLGGNQADASLAVRSNGSIVLTDEKKGKPGLLRMAAENGGRVVFLSDEFEPSGLSLGDYVRKALVGVTS